VDSPPPLVYEVAQVVVKPHHPHSITSSTLEPSYVPVSPSPKLLVDSMSSFYLALSFEEQKVVAPYVQLILQYPLLRVERR